MSDVQDPVEAALTQRGAGPVLERIETGREVVLPSLSGTAPRGRMVLARTSGQVWLVAAAEPNPALPDLSRSVAVGTGTAARASVDRRLGRPTVVIDGVRASLPADLADAGESLLQRFAADAGGPDHPFDAGLGLNPPPEPGLDAPLPDGVAPPGGAGPWRYGVATDTEVGLPGRVRDTRHRVGFGVTARAAYAVLLDRPGMAVRLGGPFGAHRGLAGTRLHGPGFVLQGGWLLHPKLMKAAELANRTEAPHAAAETDLAWAALLESREQTPPAHAAQAYLTAARRLHRAGEASRSLAAARRAAEVDLLRASTLREAAAVASVPKSTRRWWRHLAEVLEPSEADGAGAELARPPVEALDAGALAALDPGTGGWMSALRVRLSAPSLPPRDQLVRGLERLERGDPTFERVVALSGALGLEPVPTYVFRGDDPIGVSGWPCSPPVLLVGEAHRVAGPRQLVGRELDFALAVELAHLAAGHPVLAFDDSLVGTSRSVYQAFGRFAEPAELAVDLVSLIPGVDQIARLQKLIALSRRVFDARKNVDKAGKLARPIVQRVAPSPPPPRGIARDGLVGTAARLRRHADRAALRLTGDLRSATRSILLVGGAPVTRVAQFDRNGLGSLLSETPPPLSVDEVVRLGALFEDALDWARPAD